MRLLTLYLTTLRAMHAMWLTRVSPLLTLGLLRLPRVPIFMNVFILCKFNHLR